MTVCGYFSKLWSQAQRSAEPRLFTVHEKQQIDFPKWDHFHQKQPPMGSRKPCQCGGPDRWRCWHQVKQDALLGEDRR